MLLLTLIFQSCFALYVYHEDNQLLSQTNLPRKESYHGAIKTTMLM